MQNDVQQRTVNLQAPVVVDESELAESVHEKLTLPRVVPTMPASTSWLIFETTVWGVPSFPKIANKRRTRANRFSLELNN
jgi:hypothetical protein